MSEHTKVCGWCGQPLNHWGTPPEYTETCEQVYGDKCIGELDYLSQLQYEHEMRLDQLQNEEDTES